MRVEDAIRIVDGFSGSLQNGLSDSHILKLDSVIREFCLDKKFRNISWLFNALEKYPENRVVADSLARQLQKIFIFYKKQRNPFIVEPSESDFTGEIVIARCGATFYRMSFKQACLHLFVCGRTGAGKTTFQYNLFRELNKLGIRCIWVDTRKKSGRNLIREFQNTLVLQFKYDSQFRFNVLKPPPGAEIQKWRSALGEVLSTTMETFLGTRNYFFSHLAKVMNMEHSCFENIYQSVLNDRVSYHKNPRQISQKDSAIGRLTAIRNEIGPMLNCIEGYPITEIFQDHNLVVEATDTSPDVKQFIVAAFLAWLFCWLEKQPNPEKTLKYFIFIDEGNDIFGANAKGKNEVLLNLMRTIRSSGCGVCIGCQNVSGIEPEVLNNVYSKQMFSMSDGVDIERMVQSMFFSSKEQIESIFRLQEFEGIVRTPAFPELFRITIEPYFLPDVSDAEVIANNERLLSNYGYLPLPSDVLEIREENPKIDVVEDKGEKEDESKNKIVEEEIKDAEIQPTDDEKKLLMDIYTRCFESVNFKCRSLGFSGSVGFKVKKSLIDKGYVAEYPIKLGQGRGKFGKILILLDKAESVINNAPKSFYGRGASLHHSFVQQLLKLHIENLWYVKAEIEMMKNGKSTDIGLVTNDGSFIAVEFENTSVHAKENIAKDLEAGFQKVITVCDNKKVFEQINEIVKREFESVKAKITVCLLSDILLGLLDI